MRTAMWRAPMDIYALQLIRPCASVVTGSSPVWPSTKSFWRNFCAGVISLEQSASKRNAPDCEVCRRHAGRSTTKRASGSAALCRVGKQAYSVPARYAGERLRVRVWETELEFVWNGEVVERTERHRGKPGVFINWHLAYLVEGKVTSLPLSVT